MSELVARAIAGDRAAVEELIADVRDDVYHLALRMLGLRADAEDAVQEIIIQVLTHLAQFRGESSFRTWVWRIATRHVIKFRRSAREQMASFDNIEMMIAKGSDQPPLPSLPEAELKLLAEEVRLSCTSAMVMALDRDDRVAWVLGEVFELSGDELARALEVEPAAARKRLSRARDRLGAWMGKNCGIVDSSNACRCLRQVPVASAFGVARLDALQYAGHPERGRPRRVSSLALAAEASEIEAAACALRDQPDYAAPAVLIERIRGIIDSGRYLMFDA